MRFEREAAALGRWYDVYAFRIDAPERRRVAADHRTKNLLSVIASMIRLMNAGTVDAFRADLLGRILVTRRLIVKRRARA